MTSIAFKRTFALLIATSFLVSGVHAHAQQVGVTDKEILIGVANVTSGPAADLGTELNAGAQAYVDRVNAAGGVNGRKIKLAFEDDGYEPTRTTEATKKLIESNKVFALFNYVGTPTTVAAMAVLSQAQVPLIGIFSGAERFRTPVNKNIYNIRASYWNETELMVKKLIEDAGIKEIGVFRQDDAYGEAGLSGTQKALAQRGLKLQGEGKYERNTVNVDAAVDALIAAKPKAVIQVGTAKACAEFIKKAKAKGFNPIYLNLSFVGTRKLINELGAEGEGVYIVQVVPHPETSKLKVVEEYRKDLKSKQYGFGSLEGYINARVLVEGLQKMGSNVSRDAFHSVLEGLKTDLGGFPVEFSATDHQGSDFLMLTKIQKGKAVEVTGLK